MGIGLRRLPRGCLLFLHVRVIGCFTAFARCYNTPHCLFRPVEPSIQTLFFDTFKEVSSKAFISGAIILASLHLGFDIEGPLTTAQAKEFHKFVKPLLENLYETKLKGNKEESAEFQSFYDNSTPSELLKYLLKQDLSFPRFVHAG
jgi:hypothetical protein